MFKIMIVEDDTSLSEALCSLLEKYGYEVSPVTDFRDVEGHLRRFIPHLVLLDINLPYRDGFYLIRSLRRISQVPVIIISARSHDSEQVLGMELGADDYVVKPFNTDILLAKINAVVRRVYGDLALQGQQVLSVGAVTLDGDTFQAACHGKSTTLTKNEFRLLKKLMEKKGNLVKREELFEELWDDTSFVDENTLSVNVTRVKSRLEEIGVVNAIKTKRGMGYYLDMDVLKEDSHE